MLKQPLILLRLLKPQRANQSVVKPAQSTAAVTPITESEKVGSTVASAATSSDVASSDVASSESDEADSDQSKAARPKIASSQFMQRLTFRRISIGFGILSALTGFAFTQDWPTTIQTKLQPDPAQIPLKKAGDPTAEPTERIADLFLTHQIFYRKLEAISGVAITSNPTTEPNTTAPDAPEAAKAQPDTTATNAAATDSKPSLAPKVEKVTATAPPAPAAAPVVFSGTTIDSVLEMRVALARDVSEIGFATSHGGALTDLDGNPLKTLTPETAAFAKINGGIVVDGETMPSAFWVYPDEGGYVAVGSRWYRGRVLIAQRERGLIAVNYVLLGDYLYSVVGSEMSSSWAIESLKAQAIAARSYALTHNIHPASEDYFDLDNTQRFQAYKGIEREDSITRAAVLATAGEFISHEGGIVESLYAASQEIVDDAHKGSGMSQLGAKDLAEQGYAYQEILAHYYPGTALGRIETDQD
ncbi:SpoIID/LytB domain-containing protein [cf. Phormidesmis sp. LEGE 11477]|uniref:SpoIID/LytB domain-containing protein n=1 Tax=cf. Phormidesmis sp. LEGE 11477 TaxID=1828680 RepID=UPI001882B01B|nr:SpoIID/LytB domain-containing protein [cf. Phormidesmis sp. LEGE 11477]MBE9059899.1 SpoIID/LytB domain-containing protein [cf. Phormidesmis sp. LEGE 11477]